MIVHYDERKKMASFRAAALRREAAEGGRTERCGRAFERTRLVQNHRLHRDKLGGGLTCLCAGRYS